MRFLVIPIFLSLAFLSPRASASVAAFGPSNQTVTFTGLGGNASGAGQSRVTWGSCAFDGTNTKCTVTAPFTGFGGGGTISVLFSYPGNGPSPLNAVSNSPGSDVIFFSLTGPGSFLITLPGNGGDTVTFYQPAGFFFTFANPTCTGISPCGVGLTGLTPNATITGPINGTFSTNPVIRTALGVITAGAYGGFSAVAPGSWMEIYGTNLANVITRDWSADFKGNQAPTTLAGTSVTIGGVPAYTYLVSPGQINAQVPSGVAPGPQPVVVTTAGGPSLASTITVNPVEPGLLAPAVFKLPAGQYVVALFPDGITYVLPPFAGLLTARARPGDTIIMFGVGFGPVTPNIPAGQIVTQSNQLPPTFQISFAGTPATVAFAGLTAGFVGLYQFNVVVPDIAASDSVPIAYSFGGVSSPQNLIIAIRN
jgi:uncharacterized protein (TIGR03437 family)